MLLLLLFLNIELDDKIPGGQTGRVAAQARPIEPLPATLLEHTVGRLVTVGDRLR